MEEKKENLRQMTPNELSQVTGGIPYEIPDLVMLDADSTKTYCKTGRHCESGDNSTGNCISGTTCSSGSHGISET